MRKNLVLLGMMGVGKTVLAKLFADKYKMKFVDIDSKIEKKNLMSVSEIFKKKGEKFFRQEEEEVTLNYLNENDCIISLGGGAFINKKIRERVLVFTISIWLDLDINLLSDRLKKSSKRPLLEEENIKEKLKEIYAKRKNIYNLANYRINCDKLSPNKILEKIMAIYDNE